MFELKEHEHLPVGVILVDDANTVLMMNRAARTVAATSDVICVSGGKLQTTKDCEAHRLNALLTFPINGSETARSLSVTTVLGADESRSLVVAAEWIPAHRDWAIAPSPKAIVYVVDPNMAVEASKRVLSETYGLTQAESAVAALLGRGIGLGNAANRLGISINTAKTHKQRVYAKTGIRRQAELVRLVLTAAFGLPAGSI